MDDILRVDVRLTPSDEVLDLRRQLEESQQKFRELQTKFNRLEFEFRAESVITQELVDLLRANGIQYRAAIDRWRNR